MSKHTPTPWKLKSWGQPNEPAIIRDADGCDHIAVMTGTDESDDRNALFIVRACNAHEDLVEALKKIAMGIPSYPVDVRNIARAALATARGAGSGDDEIRGTFHELHITGEFIVSGSIIDHKWGSEDD